MLLQLRPGLLTAWRGPGRLQVGLEARRAVVLDGLGAADEAVLAALDGTTDLSGLLAVGARAGAPAERVRSLLGALRSAGALVPARTARHRRTGPASDAPVLSLAHPDGDGWPVLAGRARAAVVVAGGSRTGLALAHLLAAAGVGTVVVEDDAPVGAGDLAPDGYRPADVGRPRGACAAASLTARSPGTTTAPPAPASRWRPDVVALVGSGALDPVRTEALVREEVAHLPVLWRESTTVVGPLVRPGTSTCLRCVDLHRADRDPAWPRLVSQLSTALPGGAARPEETSLAALTAALAGVQVLAQLDGVPAPAALDATLEASLPEGVVALRPWTPHPACGCTWGELGGLGEPA